MSAQDNLNPTQFYHASDHKFTPGDTVDPGHPGVWQGLGYSQGHAFMASTPEDAATWAPYGHVYHVQPTGSYSQDTQAHHAYQSDHPLKVIREVPNPFAEDN